MALIKYFNIIQSNTNDFVIKLNMIELDDFYKDVEKEDKVVAEIKRPK